MIKINLKDNKTRLILFFMITGWIRVLALVIPGTIVYLNTTEWRQDVNIPTVKMEQRN